ncbi:MlaD family protein [Asticcacaulis sp. SL142]|uniref:MlaD family protein n=1 Tax=Asticcacaulis sp. SL142 TaxID=2995155 RepID=UPI00226D11DF|nr:MlaD family protein [Asticcacaulis sp. SL142]WAC49139.1 MlaD family protein [Asticcacaulis sp. SL142]
MERQAHYAFVGFVTLLLLAAGLAFTFWLVRFDFNQSYDTYDVVFTSSVSGLVEGGEVHFNGIKVGEVTDLRLGKVDNKQVIATVRLDGETPVRVDSTATLEPMGVTGLNYIQITPGGNKSPYLVRKSLSGPNPVIKGAPGALDLLLQGGGSVIQNAYKTLDRVNRLLSDKNLMTLTKSLENIENFTSDLKDREQMLNDTHEAIVSAGQAADEVARLAKSTDALVGERAPQTLAKLEDAAGRFGKASDELAKLAVALEAPATEVSETTLPDIQETLQNLNEATRSLEQLVEEARSSPQGLISKPVAKDRKVKE